MYIIFIVLLISWIINVFVTGYVRSNFDNSIEGINAVRKNTSSIIINILILLFVSFVKINIIKWIAIVYTVIMTIMGIMFLFTAITTGIIEDKATGQLDRFCWTLTFSNCLREISNITLIIALFVIN